MRILPVLDLMGGIPVHGIAGQRTRYRPVCSGLSDDASTLALAHAFRDRLGLDAIYVADLDAILHRKPNFDQINSLCRDGFDVWVDAGFRDVNDVDHFRRNTNSQLGLVVGLETWRNPRQLTKLPGQLAANRWTVSLDLIAESVLSPYVPWQTATPLRVVAELCELGVERLIVLDLSRVGTGVGPSGLDLIGTLKQRWPSLEVWSGGGVSSRQDLERLRSAGCDGVLVASSLHDGRIGRQDLDALEQ